MIKRRLFLITLFFILIFSNSLLFTNEYLIEGSKIKICILSYDTEFKKNLTEELVKDFNSKGISIIADTISKNSQYNASDYDAVILLSGAFMFKPRSLPIKYIKANNYSSNIIYVFTTKKEYSPYGKSLDKNKIDAITSASVKKNDIAFGDIKNKIIKKAMDIINK